jgi:SAM-dependent methyltransferase
MYKRFELTLAECQPVVGKKILDIGCGSGRFCIPLARRGANKVLGIDFAQNMIDLAVQLANEQGVDGSCEFYCADFLSISLEEKFDYVIAVGLFDYIKDPQPYFRKISTLTKEKFVATFPTKWTYRRLLRKIRLKLYGCPVYFFSKCQIKKMCLESGFVDVSMKRIGKIYFVVAKFSENLGKKDSYETATK